MTMPIAALRQVVRGLAIDIVLGNFDSLVRRCSRSRLTSEDLRNVIRDYGRTLVLPPDDAYADLDVVRVTTMEEPTWSVHAPLWTIEEGRSDLSLELTITLTPGAPLIELDNLRVP
jgi:hypothetical protein